jgi:hypothetical protein
MGVTLIFFLNDLLAKPDGFDGIVFAARSKLRRRSSGKNQCTRIVFIDSDVHSAGIGIVVIRLLNTNGNTNFVNEGNDGQELAATTTQGNDLSFHSGSGCLGLKFGRPIDGTACNCDDIAHATAYTHGVIIVLVSVETSKISIGIGIQ